MDFMERNTDEYEADNLELILIIQNNWSEVCSNFYWYLNIWVKILNKKYVYICFWN